jgi:hypothetical protein
VNEKSVRNIKVVPVNDESTDDTMSITCELAAKDERLVETVPVEERTTSGVAARDSRAAIVACG